MIIQLQNIALLSRCYISSSLIHFHYSYFIYVFLFLFFISPVDSKPLFYLRWKLWMYSEDRVGVDYFN